MLGKPESDASAAATATLLRRRRLRGSACEMHSAPPASTFSHGARRRRRRTPWSPSLCRHGGLGNPGFAAIMGGSTDESARGDAGTEHTLTNRWPAPVADCRLPLIPAVGLSVNALHTELWEVCCSRAANCSRRLHRPASRHQRVAARLLQPCCKLCGYPAQSSPGKTGRY